MVDDKMDNEEKEKKQFQLWTRHDWFLPRDYAYLVHCVNFALSFRIKNVSVNIYGEKTMIITCIHPELDIA